MNSDKIFVFESDDKYKELRDWFPHYSDKRFEQPRSIYLATGYTATHPVAGGGDPMVEAASYVYGDRLPYMTEEQEELWKELLSIEVYPQYSAAREEARLRILYEDPRLQLVHVLAGVNLGNGYPYRIYGIIKD